MGRQDLAQLWANSHLEYWEKGASVALCQGPGFPAHWPLSHSSSGLEGSLIITQRAPQETARIFCEALLLLLQPSPPFRSGCGVRSLASNLWIPTSAWRLPDGQTSQLATAGECYLWRLQFGVGVILLAGSLSLIGLSIYTTLSSSATASSH